jgi:hypothetical protein
MELAIPLQPPSTDAAIPDGFEEYECTFFPATLVLRSSKAVMDNVVVLPSGNKQRRLAVHFGDRILINTGSATPSGAVSVCQCMIPPASDVYWVIFSRGERQYFEKCLLPRGTVAEQTALRLKVDPITPLPSRCSHPDCYRAPTLRCAISKSGTIRATVCDKLYCEAHTVPLKNTMGEMSCRQCPVCAKVDNCQKDITESGCSVM